MQNLLDKASQELHTNYKLCERHFYLTEFSDSSKSRLKRDAVPTIFSEIGPTSESINRKRKAPMPRKKYIPSKRTKVSEPVLEENSHNFENLHSTAVSEIQKLKDQCKILQNTIEEQSKLIEEMN